MNWKSFGIALLTVMVLVAGCLGGPAENGTTQTTNTARQTKTATTTNTTIAPTNADLPPGVTTGGVSNASVLVSAHESALTETGFQFVFRTSGHRDGKPFDAVQRGRAAAGLSTVLYEVNATSDTAYHSVVWKNDSTTVVEITNGGKTRYQVHSRIYRGVAKSYTIREMLRSGEFAVAHVERVGGQTLTTLRADRYSGDGGFENVSAYNATLVVDSAGCVHEFHWRVETEKQSRTVDFELTATHSAAIERPDWVDKAGEFIAADIRTSTESGRLVISHRGGDVLPAGSKIELGHDGKTYTATFDQPLETGETAYLYFPKDGGDPILTTTDPGTDAGVRFDGSYSLSIVSPGGVVISSSGFAVGHASSSASSTS